MPIFGRRQLQYMLNNLGPWLSQPKAKDLIGRIESRDPDQSIPGEYELALAYGVSQVAGLEIDVLAGTRRPDIFSSDLIPSAPIAIDVTAMSDDPLSGESLMKRAANIINQEAARHRRVASKHLHYTFLEERKTLPANRYSNGFTRYVRHRCITKKFNMSDDLRTALRHWLKAIPSKPLRFRNDEIDVVIEWKERVHPATNTFSSMPSVTYSERENPLYNLLKSKAKQLRDVPEGTLRGIFLGDAGCSLLRDIRPFTGRQEVSGDQIIQRFLLNNKIDLVAVFVPRRRNEIGLWHHNNPRIWHLYIYSFTLKKEQFAKIEAIRDTLPNPHLHGYQARSWHKQGMTLPQARGQYLAPKWTGGKGKMKVHISARGLQEFLVGRLSKEQLKNFIIGDPNPFEFNLANGKMITEVRFESTGTEKDDDYLVFEFDDDPAASPLNLPSNLNL